MLSLGSMHITTNNSNNNKSSKQAASTISLLVQVNTLTRPHQPQQMPGLSPTAATPPSQP
jgi:hypothetical protein